MARAPHGEMIYRMEASSEVLDYFRQKSLTPSFDWRDVWPEEHAHAFTVAKATQLDVLRTIREEVDAAIAQGLPFDDFRDRLTPRLQSLGWWGRQEVTDPLTGERMLAQLGSPHRLRIIYDANIRTANAAGQWARIQRVKDALPFLVYEHTTSIEPREEHWAWAERPVVLPVDDPWWDTHYPPNGWQCKCWVLNVDEETARAKGWTPRTKAPAIENVEWYNARRDETMLVPKGIDPGWATNPGKTRASLLDALLSNKLDDADPAIRANALKNMSTDWLFRQITEGKITAVPDVPAAKPALRPEIIDKMLKRGAGGADVAAPAGHLGEAIQSAQAWRSGVVWIDPAGVENVEYAASLAPGGKASIDWALIPRVIDEGAVVRHETNKDWVTIYRRINGRGYRAEVALRSLAPDGSQIAGGPRLRLEKFTRIDTKLAAAEIRVAKSDGRLLRAEAAPSYNVYNTPPAALPVAAETRPKSEDETPSSDPPKRRRKKSD